MVLFLTHQKILLADKLEKLQFVLPFPVSDSQIDKFVHKIANKMDELWNTPNYGCKLVYSNIT